MQTLTQQLVIVEVACSLLPAACAEVRLPGSDVHSVLHVQLSAAACTKDLGQTTKSARVHSKTYQLSCMDRCILLLHVAPA